MKNINLKTLQEEDLYNLILYAIFKFTDNPLYSTISELIYTIDKDSLLNFCSIFGGCVLKVPTLEELKIFTSALLIYQLVNEEGKTFDEAFIETGLDIIFKKKVLSIYSTIEKVVEDYEK